MIKMKMKLFAKKNGFQPFTLFAKSSIEAFSPVAAQAREQKNLKQCVKCA